jgi:hypothetical protein
MTQTLREYIVHIPFIESYANLTEKKHLLNTHCSKLDSSKHVKLENLQLFVTDKINIVEFEMFCIT